MSERVGGIIKFQVDGTMFQAEGAFTYNLGHPKREAKLANGAVAGYIEKPQIPFIEGEIIDDGTLDHTALVKMTGKTVTVELANGKVIALASAWYAHEGDGETDEGKIGVRFESKTPAAEIR